MPLYLINRQGENQMYALARDITEAVDLYRKAFGTYEEPDTIDCICSNQDIFISGNKDFLSLLHPLHEEEK